LATKLLFVWIDVFLQLYATTFGVPLMGTQNVGLDVGPSEKSLTQSTTHDTST
jgi:hypothetical protein